MEEKNENTEMSGWPNPPALYRRTRRFVNALVRLFFRRVEVTGLENIPRSGGGILVAWHPNGLVDPGLIIARCPRQVIFGARHGLFNWPLLKNLLRALGVVPIYRSTDQDTDVETRRAQNAKSLSALAQVVAEGAFTALFPEGDSHDQPYVMDLKTGTARLYYQARLAQSEDETPPVIIPVGLHYDEKQLFRSHALVAFHPPISLPPELDLIPAEGESDEDAFARARALTERIESELHEVVHATESWELHNLLHRARKIVRAERIKEAGSAPGKAKIKEKVLGFSRVWKGYEIQKERTPEKIELLVQKIGEYHDDLEALGLEDEELDRDPRLISPWLPIILLLQLIAVFFLLPPFLIMGYLINVPPALLLRFVTYIGARKGKDTASLKILIGAVLFPCTWILYGVLAALGQIAIHEHFPNVPSTPILAGIVMFLMGAFSGAVAVRYLRVARETLRSVRVRLTRRMRAYTIERLRLERFAFYESIIGLAEGLDLPGEVAPDGTIQKSS